MLLAFKTTQIRVVVLSTMPKDIDSVLQILRTVQLQQKIPNLPQIQLQLINRLMSVKNLKRLA